MTCAVCGIETTKAHFCSKNCEVVSHELAKLWYKKDPTTQDMERHDELQTVIELAQIFNRKG